MVDKEDDWSDEKSVRSNGESFAVHETCYSILLECRRYRGVGLRDEGDEFDRFINDFGAILRCFHDNQSSQGCRLEAPWYAKKAEYDIVHSKMKPIVQFRVGRTTIKDKGNRSFADPNCKVFVETDKLPPIPPVRPLPIAHREPSRRPDCFAKLPEEMRTEILTWLPSQDVAALRLASRTISERRLSASFWLSRLASPELQMTLPTQFKEATKTYPDKGGIVCTTLFLRLPGTRIAKMAYEALWHVQAHRSMKETQIQYPYWVPGSHRDPSMTASSRLRAGTVPFPPSWFSSVRFDPDSPFQVFNVITMFFHSPRRHFHGEKWAHAETEEDRYLTGIRFENRLHSKDLGYCRSQDTTQISLPGRNWFVNLKLRIDAKHGVCVQSISSTDGVSSKNHDVFRSRLARPFEAQYEEINLSGAAEIQMGLTRDCRIVVFDVLVSKPAESGRARDGTPWCRCW
jgi:hypothetical protein